MLALICRNAGKIMGEFSDIHRGDMISLWEAGSQGYRQSWKKHSPLKQIAKMAADSSWISIPCLMSCQSFPYPDLESTFPPFKSAIGYVSGLARGSLADLCTVTCPLATFGNQHLTMRWTSLQWVMAWWDPWPSLLPCSSDTQPLPGKGLKPFPTNSLQPYAEAAEEPPGSSQPSLLHRILC